MKNDSVFNYDEAFSRNIGLLTEEQQQKLRNTTVAIAGLGGSGGVCAQTLARLGIGKFHIADLDNFEVGNMNRQFGATMETIGKSKVESIEKLIHSINPEAEIKTFPLGINKENIGEFLEGVDVALDGIDFFTIEARRLLLREARNHGVYVVSAGPIGYGSSLLVFDPKGMSAEDYFNWCDEISETEKLLRFGLGVTPTIMQRSYFHPDAINWKNHKAPSLITGIMLVGNLVSTEVLKIIFGEKVRPAPSSLHFDPYLRKLKLVWMPWGNRNPIQRIKLLIMKRVMKSRGAI